MPTPWQRIEVAPVANTGVPTNAVIVTVCVAVVELLHPLAVAVMIVLPFQLES